MQNGEPRFGQWVREHAGLIPVILTGLAFLFVVLHLVVVSRFNATTARALVESAGPGTVIMATLVSALFPVLVTLFLFFAVVRAVESISGGKKLPRYSQFVPTALFAVLIFIPMWVVGLIVVYGVVLYVARIIANRWRRRAKNPLAVAWLRSKSDRGIVITVVLVVTFLSTASVWVPSERVTLASGRQMVAYVLGEEAGWYTLMTETDRRIVQVPVHDVGNRRVCALPDDSDFWEDSFAERLVGGDEASYPPCEHPEPAPAPSPTV